MTVPRGRTEARYPRPDDVVNDAILNGLLLLKEQKGSYIAERSDHKVIRVHKRTWKPGKAGRIVPREDRGITWNATDGSLCLTPTVSLKGQRERLLAAQAPPPPPEPDPTAPPKPEPGLPVEGPAPISYSVMANQQARAIQTVLERLDAFAHAIIGVEERLDRIEALLRPLAE